VKINWRASPLHTAIIGLLNSLLQLVSAFGIQISAQQNAAITAVTNSLLFSISVGVVYATNGNNGEHGATRG